MAATCAGLGDFQVQKPSCESNLAVLGLTEALCCLFDRIYEPRPAILMEKQLGWASKIGWGGAPRDLQGQTVLASLMESQIWQQSAGSMSGGPRKRDNSLC